MNTIGFNNFRKFTEFPAINLGDITLLVGANNSGKSTLVKALLLMRDFLTQKIYGKQNIFETLTPDFRFDSNYIHIGSFKRAFCNKAEENQDSISFTTGICNFSFEVEVKGDRSKDSSLPFVSKLSIEDTKRGVKLVFDYATRLMSATFQLSEVGKAKNIQIAELKHRLEELSNLDVSDKSLEEIVKVKDEQNLIDAKLRALGNSEDDGDLTITFNMTMTLNVVGSLLIPELIRQFSHYASTGTTGDKRTIEYKKEESDKNILQGKSLLINEMAAELESLLSVEQIEYIYAHSANQQVLFAIKDSDDFLSKTIHEFKIARISEGDEEYRFVQEWMEKFEIGVSFNIETISGEAYQVSITDIDNDTVQLADKGMGSIQVMILLLRLATLIRRYKNAANHVLILIEEPEQNLHPSAQSLLADLLYEVQKEYGCRFIVETHSEYLVRRSQVIVATYYGSKELLDNNPFITYYMPRKGLPYSMSYKENGRFEEKFDVGFFDEAGKSNLELMRKERGMS